MHVPEITEQIRIIMKKIDLFGTRHLCYYNIIRLRDELAATRPSQKLGYSRIIIDRVFL